MLSKPPSIPVNPDRLAALESLNSGSAVSALASVLTKLCSGSNDVEARADRGSVAERGGNGGEGKSATGGVVKIASETIGGVVTIEFWPTCSSGGICGTDGSVITGGGTAFSYQSTLISQIPYIT